MSTSPELSTETNASWIRYNPTVKANELLIYTFSNWNSACNKLLKALFIPNVPIPNVEVKYIRGLQGVNNLVKQIEANGYLKVLGLGNYRKDAKRIRIEGRFVNRYGKNVIVPGAPEYLYPSWNHLKGKIPNSYVADKPSNGPCNRSGYLISSAISKRHFPTKFAFLHVPKLYQINRLIAPVMSLLTR